MAVTTALRAQAWTTKVYLTRWYRALHTRVRFAPSPTGDLHLGGLRTALYNYLFAEHNQGQLIVRIEDTDQNRLVPGAAERLLATLRWAKINYHEGPDIGGDYGPYYQSQRTQLYQEHAQLLVQRGKAYRCFCTAERLAALRASQVQAGRPPMYDRKCSHLSSAAVDELVRQGTPHTIRLRYPAENLPVVPDQVYGQVRANPGLIDDAVLLKSDGFPTYHLASVVDDHFMAITHVMRGEEWLSSTSKHIALYNAFGWPLPQFAHLPLLLNPDGTKLSKRSGDVHVEHYKQRGYLPEALINYVALLGWSPNEPRDIFTMPDLITKFGLAGINTSNPSVSYEKLNWLNRQHFRQQWDSNTTARTNMLHLFSQQVRETYPAQHYSDSYIAKALELCKDRMTTLSDFPAVARMCFELPRFSDCDKLTGASNPFLSAALTVARHSLPLFQENLHLTETTEPTFATFIASLPHRLVQKTGLKKGPTMKALRFSLTGLTDGPALGDLMKLFGPHGCTERIAAFHRAYLAV